MLTVPGETASIKLGAVGLRRRIQRGRPLAPVLFLSLGLWGCASALKAPPAAPIPPPRAATLDEVLAAYDGFCKGLETFSASGDLDVHDRRTGRSQRLGVRLLATRGGRLYLKGTIAFVTALEIVADGERFWFQVPSKKTVWTGPADSHPRDDSQRAPYYALRPKDLTRALIPEALAPQAEEALVLEADRQTFSMTLAQVHDGRGVALRRIWVDRQALRPLRSRIYGERGDLVLETSFGQWSDGKPHFVAVSRPEEGYDAVFTLSKVEENVTVPDRVFVPRIPEGYKVEEIPE